MGCFSQCLSLLFNFILKNYFIFVCVCASIAVWVCAYECIACRGQKREVDPLDLELQSVVSLLTWVL